MNKEIKDRWLTALRSGNYKQTPGQLGIQQGDNTAYCCLGVLCEIAVEDNIVSRDIRPTGTIEYVSGPERDRMVLPKAVVAWAEITDGGIYGNENPFVNVEGFDVVIDGEHRATATFSELNDYAGFPFSKIADVIEREL